MIVLSFLLLPLAVADTAAVPAAGDSILVLPEVRVERARVPTGARRRLPTASVSEIEAGTAGRALETVAELLGGTPGVRVQQYGGLGAFSTVSLRGAPPAQVSVYLDGAPLTSAAHGVVSLGDLPATALDHIEVYRGLSPLTLGGAAPGGAIHLVTVSAPELRVARIARGAFGTWEARGSAGARRGDLSGLVHAGYQQSEGDFTYLDDNGTPLNPDDDGMSTRVNNRFTAATVLASLGWHPGERWQVHLRGDVFDKAQGVPGLGAVPSYASHLDYARALGRLEASREGGRATPTLRMSAGLARERTRFRDPDARLGLGYHDTDDRTGGEDLALELAWDERGAWSLAAVGNVRQERARPTDAADSLPDPPESRRVVVGGAATVQWRPAAGRLVAHAGLRADRLSDRIHGVEVGGAPSTSEVARTLTTPQLGVRVAGPARVELRANWTDAKRPPDFLELFGNQGSVRGNPALRPERARNWDVGASWSGTPRAGLTASLDVVHFESRSDDLVVYIGHSQRTVKAENIARAVIRGEELSLTLRTAPITFSGGLTHMDARDRGPVPYWTGRFLPLRPQLQAFTRLDGQRGRFRAVADLQYIGSNYLHRANFEIVPDRLLVGSSLTFTPHGGLLRFTLEGKNLGGDPVSDVGGFPLPGRALFASCELRLGPAPSAHP